MIDASKPILPDVGGQHSGCFYRQLPTVRSITSHPPHVPADELEYLREKCRTLELERNMFREKYQQLYYSYKDLQRLYLDHKSLNSYVKQLETTVQELENRLSYSSNNKNNSNSQVNKLRSTLLERNTELKDAYIKLQKLEQMVKYQPSEQFYTPAPVPIQTVNVVEPSYLPLNRSRALAPQVFRPMTFMPPVSVVPTSYTIPHPTVPLVGYPGVAPFNKIGVPGVIYGS